ncbi:MAG: type B 50S ribosomal protein L31 [Flavobacteriaceae bacterium]
MRKNIHPENYRLVAFKDMSNDDVFLTKSTADTKETLEVDGVEYPLVKLEISRTSHPFYTGKAKFLDTAGRIDKFKNKYDKFKKAAPAAEEVEPAKSAKSEVKDNAAKGE